ncbi:hypothetical protein GCM10010402_38920 [Actinomadura luteofluorescens]
MSAGLCMFAGLFGSAGLFVVARLSGSAGLPRLLLRPVGVHRIPLSLSHHEECAPGLQAAWSQPESVLNAYMS